MGPQKNITFVATSSPGYNMTRTLLLLRGGRATRRRQPHEDFEVVLEE